MGGELPRVTRCHTKAIVKYQKKRLLYTMLQSTSMTDSDTRSDYQGTQELFVVNSVKCFFFLNLDAIKLHTEDFSTENENKSA